jgi:hypothetical protein
MFVAGAMGHKMPGTDWSRQEVEACVAAYLHMLTLELNGQHFVKSHHNMALLEKLDQRSKQSIEFKHANISAVLVELGYPYIEGYKPRSNIQDLLLDVVEQQLQSNPEVGSAAENAVSRPASAIPLENIGLLRVETPQILRITGPVAEYAPSFSAAKRDYLAQESRNRSLGHAGERLVLEMEARRLYDAGKKVLSNRVEHVSKSQGDGLGYDILSFEASGKERLIEVKTTSFGQFTPFYVSRNELARSRADADIYHLHRIFDFRGKPRFFEIRGEIAGKCNLEPVSYLARLA